MMGNIESVKETEIFTCKCMEGSGIRVGAKCEMVRGYIKCEMVRGYMWGDAEHHTHGSTNRMYTHVLFVFNPHFDMSSRIKNRS